MNYIYKGRTLKHALNNKGYVNVVLCKKNVQKTHKVHRLVMDAFGTNPLNKPTINHKDGNKQNNEFTNLEWATYSEQIIHAYKSGLKNTEANSKEIYCLELKVSQPSIKKMGHYLRELGIVDSWATGQTGVSKALKYGKKYRGLTFWNIGEHISL